MPPRVLMASSAACPRWALVPLRVVAGLILLTAGYEKLFGLGLRGVQAAFATMGVPLPDVAGPAVAVLELVGGAGLLVGFYTRWWGLLFAIEFAVAAVLVNLPRGWEALWVDLLLLAAGLAFAGAGGGALSVDSARARRSESASSGA